MALERVTWGMGLDVDIPAAPSLSGPQSRGEYEAIDMTDREPDDDYRRDELGGFLADGAWQDAFEEWAEHTAMSDAELETVVARDLVDAFDFYWDPSDDQVGYRAPELAADDRDAFEDPGGVESELDSLGRVVSEMLENDYLLRDDEDFGFFADDETGKELEDGNEN